MMMMNPTQENARTVKKPAQDAGTGLVSLSFHGRLDFKSDSGLKENAEPLQISELPGAVSGALGTSFPGP